MYRHTDFLGTHWLTLALLAAAAVASGRVVLRRAAGRGTPAGAVAVAFACGLLGLGGAFAAGWAFTDPLFGYRLTVAEALLIVAAGVLVAAGVVLAFTRAWSFWVGVAVGAVALLGLGGWAVRP